VCVCVFIRIHHACSHGPQRADTYTHRMLTIESLDADHEIRRISPVALSSSDGYTALFNGCQDHGWCFSYTCLKRLMTFWTVVGMGRSYTVHFSGSEPQALRLSLLGARPAEKMVIRIYYTKSLRLQVRLEACIQSHNFIAMSAAP
jgi:hypothetical protein